MACNNPISLIIGMMQKALAVGLLPWPWTASPLLLNPFFLKALIRWAD